MNKVVGLLNKLPKRHIAIFFVLFCGIVIGSFGVLEIRTIHANIVLNTGKDKVDSGVSSPEPTTQVKDQVDNSVSSPTSAPVVIQSTPTITSNPSTGGTTSNPVSVPISTPNPCH